MVEREAWDSPLQLAILAVAADRAIRRKRVGELVGRTGMAINVASGALLACNLPGTYIVSFPGFLVSNILIATGAVLQRDTKLVVMQVCLALLSSVGVYRWLI